MGKMLAGIIFLFLVNLTQEDIIASVENFVECDGCEVKILSIHIPFGKDISNFDSVELVPQDSKPFGRKIFRAYFSENGKNFIGTVFVYVDKKVDVLVAKRRIDKKEVAQMSDFEQKKMPLTTVPKDYISPADFPAGRIFKVPLRKGEILRKVHLEEDYEIRKGEQVKIVLRSGNIYLEFPALALSNGKVGELIKVRNITSNKIVYGVVREGKIVEVSDDRETGYRREKSYQVEEQRKDGRKPYVGDRLEETD